MSKSRRNCPPVSSYKGVRLPSNIKQFGYVIDEDGERVFKLIGERDIQADIDSYRSSCDYQLIMEELLKQEGSSFDYDDSEIIELVKNDKLDIATRGAMLRDEFYSLPLEVRVQYENNYAKFARSVESGEFSRNMLKGRKLVEDTENNIKKSIVDDTTQLRKELEALKARLDSDIEGGIER